MIVMIRQNVFEQIFWIRGFALNFLADAIRCDLDLRLVVQNLHVFRVYRRNAHNLSLAVTIVKFLIFAFVWRDEHCVLLSCLKNSFVHRSLKIDDRN